MTIGLFGLNAYRANRRTELGFTNFQWTLEGAVARCAQPRYTGGDSSHSFGPVEITFLKKHNIRCIISANEFEIPKVSQTLLRNAGISYHHYGVRDFHPPTQFQLQSAANFMQTTIAQGGAAMVYCGYGQGRTGTFVAGWAVLHYLTQHPTANINGICSQGFLDHNFGVERPEQVNAIRSAANLAVAPVANTGAFGTSNPFHSGFSTPSFTGPQGYSTPSASSFGFNFANFSSGPSF